MFMKSSYFGYILTPIADWTHVPLFVIDIQDEEL